MEGYSAKVVKTSREVSAKERVMLKDTTDAVQLDKLIDTDSIYIAVDMYAEIAVHNDRAEDKDYKKYVVVDKDGTKYVTGSESFWSAFNDIASDMEGEEEEWGIKVYKVPSKNYNGRSFITCSIA